MTMMCGDQRLGEGFPRIIFGRSLERATWRRRGAAALFNPGQSSQNGMIGSALAWAHRRFQACNTKMGRDAMDRSSFLDGFLWFGNKKRVTHSHAN